MIVLPVLTYKLLILSFITAKRQLIHNRTAQRSTWNPNYDFIIVGAGTAGCVVAKRLTEDPKVTVLLLEAGGAQDAIYSDIPGMYSLITRDRPDLEWFYYNEPEQYPGQNPSTRRLRSTMGKQIGGSSSHNGMGFLRQQQQDYDNWVKTYGAKGWSFREVLPYLRKFENNTDWNVVNSSPGYHGINGPVQITTHNDVDPILIINKRVFNELGFMDIDLNGANRTGTMIEQTYIDLNGFRSSAGNAYIDPNPHPNNLHIVTRAQVIRILFNGTTAIGVEFNRFDTNNRVFALKEVILSAGAYQSPHLLMLSGIGPRSNLQSFGIPVLQDLPVGTSFIQIPTIGIGSIITNSNLTNPPPRLTLFNLDQLYSNRSGPLTRVPSLLLYFSSKYNSNKKWPNIRILVLVGNGQLIFVASPHRVRSRGTASLQSSSPYIPLKLNANILSDPRDLDNAIEGMKFIFYVMERTSLAQYVRPPTFESFGCPSCQGKYLYECDESIRCYILAQYTANAILSTCRMGQINRTDVVVDPLLRVKNIQNLRICDNSILPDTNSFQANALLIGERCSQFIKECYNLF